MKKLFFSTLIICCVSTASAQMKMGIRVAPQITWSTGDNKITTTNGTRVNAAYGLMLDYFFSENYALGTELCIQSFGTNLNVPQEHFDYVDYQGKHYTNDQLSYNYQLRYFSIPLMIKMRTNENGNIRYYAEFGYGSGFLIRSKADISIGTLALDNVNINNPDEGDKFSIEKQGYSDKVATYRGSLIIGAGIQYKMFGNSMFVAGLRFDNGFTSFTVDDHWSTSLSNLALNIGILF